ncbi:MAG: hypothetical protein LUC22_02950 [Prevotella sp.]|nr:hypothetical protein [Prevotella sp.]
MATTTKTMAKREDAAVRLTGRTLAVDVYDRAVRRWLPFTMVRIASAAATNTGVELYNREERRICAVYGRSVDDMLAGKELAYAHRADGELIKLRAHLQTKTNN